MVAIVTGAGLGLDTSSKKVFAAVGQAGGELGDSSFGRYGENITVNAATGNLMIDRTDEVLIGMGPDDVIGHAYNSQTTSSTDGYNGFHDWQFTDARAITLASGTLGVDGSTLQRIDADGSNTTYTCSGGVYTCNQAGSRDYRVTYNATSNTLTWTDPKNNYSETYDVAHGGRLSATADTYGNTLTYHYDSNNLLQWVTTQDGEKTSFNYTGTQVTSITTKRADNTTLTRVYYGYDPQGRLSTVTVDLSPNDNTLGSDAVTTTYSYFGNTDRVKKIVQTGGAEVDFTYVQQTSGIYAVQTVTQSMNGAVTQLTKLTYGTGQTTVTDQYGNNTIISYDANDQMTGVTYPPDPNGATPSYTYTYTAAGDLQKVFDAYNLQVAKYNYDSNDNLILAQDELGNAFNYTYDANNHVVTKTLTAGAGQSGQTGPTPVTTRYAYNAQGSLRFVVDPDGEVTEYRYDGTGLPNYGLRTAKISYTSDVYDVSTLAATATISESQLASWVAGPNTLATTAERTDYAYDLRGNISSTTSYSADNADGTGNTSAPATVVNYVYDQAGNLLQRYTSNATTNVEQYTYDGLNRIVTAKDLLGSTTTTTWTDASNQVQVSYANGLVQTSYFDLAGDLIHTTNSSSTLPAENTYYKYDAMGRLGIATDADGVSAYTLYDNLGRVSATVTDDGSVKEYRYDLDSRLIATVSYATQLNSNKLGQLVDANGNPTNVAIATIRPATDPADVWSWRVYDADSRLAETIDGDGDVTTYAYDDMSNVTATTTFYKVLTTAQVTGFQATPPTVPITPAPNAADDTTYSYYDDEGRIVGMQDGDGNLSRIFYDHAGRQIQTTSYATQISNAHRGDSWSSLLSIVSTPPNGSDISNYYFYDDRGLMLYSLNGLLQATQYIYDGAGRAVETMVYNNPVASHPSYTLAYIQLQLTPHVGDADNRRSFNVYDTATGTLDYAIDAAGGVTKFTYDNMGNVVRRTQYADTYSPTSPPSITDVTNNVTASGALDRITRYAYDSMGRLRYAIDAEGYVTETRYSAAGRASLSVAYTGAYTLGGNPSESTLETWSGYPTPPADAIQTSYTYDADGRLTDVISDTTGFMADTHTDYDAFGRVQRVTEALGTNANAKTLYVYDTANRLKSVTRAYQTSDASTTSYTYDGEGNVLTQIDGNNNTTTYTYDAAGQLLTKTNSLATGNQTSYTYDAFGNVLTTTDPLNNVSYAWYDALNRVVLQADQLGYLTATTYSLGGAVASVTRYGKPVTIVGGAKPTSIPPDPSDATTLFARDKLDRIVGTTDADGFFESYQLDAFGDRLVTIAKSSDGTLSAGGETDDAYDRLGHVYTQTVLAAAYGNNGLPEKSTIVNTYTYDAFGNMKTKIEASNTAEKRTTTYTYDKLNRLSTVTGDAFDVVDDANVNNPTAGFVPVTTYTYDLRGNVIKVVDAGGGITQSYYDDLDRKVAQIDALGDYATWTYDGNGNMLTASAYDKAFNPNSPPNAGGPAPNPPAGSTARVTTYAYDAINRLTTTTVANVLTGSFSGGGYTTTTGSVVTTNAYNSQTNELHQTDGNGNSSYIYYDNLGRVVATVDQDKYFTLYKLDANGNVLTETRYANAYGATITGSTQLATIASYFDPTSGAHNDAVNDRITQFAYDRDGRRLSETRLNVAYATISGATVTTATGNSTVAYTYNGLGEVLTKTEATTDRTTYTYDSAGRQVAVDETAFTQNGVTKQLHTIQDYDGLGNLIYTDSYDTHNTTDQRVTTYVYGAGGLLKSVTDPTNFTRTFVYDKMGRAVLSRYDRLHSDGTYTTDADVTLYDRLGRVTSQGTATLSGTWQLNDMQGTTYDTFGEVTARTIHGVVQQSYAYDNAGRMWKSNDAGVITLYLYDANGNQTLCVTSDGTPLASGTWDGFVEGTGIANSYVDAMGTIGVTAVQGMVETITIYDGRNQSTQTRLPQRQLSANYYNASDIEDLNTLRSYNAFGEVISERNEGVHTTTFTYNTMGKVISQVMPSTTVYDEHNSPTTYSPVQYNYYDLSGRLIGVEDADGNVNTLALLANTGYDGSQALTTVEYHADGGQITNIYDAFQELTESVTKISTTANAVTDYTYYDNGTLHTVTHPTAQDGSHLVDTYTYDGLGQRLTHWNSQFGSTILDRTDYDAEGRVAGTIDMQGHATTYGYQWKDALTTGGLGQFGGWTKTTTLVDSSRVETEDDDSDGRTIDKTDFGGNVFGYTYDGAGWLSTRTDSYIPAGAESGGGFSPSGETITYAYYNTGLVKEIASEYEYVTDLPLIPWTVYYDNFGTKIADYSYDKDGNQVFEDEIDRLNSTLSGGTPLDMLVEYETATYNNLDRITSLQGSAPTISGVYTMVYEPITINWKYDANGNIRERKSTYYMVDSTDTISGTKTTEDDWYTYDSMNRFLKTQGRLDGSNNIVTTVTGTTITYDLAGERLTAVQNGESDTYHYALDGHLTQADITTSGGTAHAYYTNDDLGRVKYYEEDDAGGNDIYSKSTTFNYISQDTHDVVYTVRPGDGTYTWTTNYDYDEYGTGGYNGVYDDGVVTHSSTTTTKQGSGSLPGTDSVYSYIWFDGAAESAETYDSDTGNSGNALWTSNLVYDQRHDLDSAGILDGYDHTVSYSNNIDGQVTHRVESVNPGAPAPDEFFFYFGGIQVGDISNNGTSNTDYGASITQQTAKPGGGFFTNGASTGVSYGDFSQSYDAINGLTYGQSPSTYTVQAGDTLQSIAQQVWGDSNFWYLLAAANGLDGSSQLDAGVTLVIPNAVTNNENNTSTYRVYDPNAHIGNTSPTHPPKPQPQHHGGCGVLGEILMAVVAVVVTVLTYGALAPEEGALLAGAVAGAAGGIASQTFGVLTGIQKSFNWGAVALSTIGGMVGAGVGADGLDLFGDLSNVSEDLVQVLQGATSNAITQGIGVATGLQKSFDWGQVAAAGISAGVSNEVGDWAMGETFSSNAAVDDMVGVALKGTAGLIAGAATHSLISGTDFGDDILKGLPSVIGDTVGGEIADYLTRPSSTPAAPNSSAGGSGAQYASDAVDQGSVAGGTQLTANFSSDPSAKFASKIMQILNNSSSTDTTPEFTYQLDNAGNVYSWNAGDQNYERTDSNGVLYAYDVASNTGIETVTVGPDYSGFPSFYANWAKGHRNAPAFVSANSWGKIPPIYSRMTPASQDGRYNMITLHHTGSEDTAMSVDQFDRGQEGSIHYAERWIKNLGNVESYTDNGDITYHFLIGGDGTIYEGRSLAFEGAHVSGMNPQNIGIAFLGDYSSDPLTDAQVNSAESLIQALNDAYDVSGNADGEPYIYTHADLAPPDGIHARPVELVGAQQQTDAIKEWSMTPKAH
jgi:YD repeat-containing protein